MANVIGSLFGGNKPAENPDPVKADSDFAEFAEGADPRPADAPFTPNTNTFGARPAQTLLPASKWYEVHKRHSIDEFKAEGMILSVIAVMLIFHLFGARLNRTKAKKWIRAHTEPLASEFALVGFGRVSPTEKKGDELIQALAEHNLAEGDNLLRENSLFEFATYATGRANVAFLDVKLTLLKRFNPLTTLFESVFGFFIESFPAPQDICEATIYPFDGKESQVVPGMPGAAELSSKDTKSSYDGFVWAIVHKDKMKQVRDDRFDVSLTVTKDHAKLPAWLTVMTESAEITDLLLTPELIKAAETAGDNFEYLIVSDQPLEQPKTLNDTTPSKRIFLRYHLPSDNEYTNLVPIFKYFLRLPDQLAKSAHFRPEVLKKVKAARDATINKIKKAEDEEKAEERAAERERARKAKRDQELNALDAKGQKKYLEKEREKQMKKGVKKTTARA
ncbi:coiled-coil domain-containing protein 47 [Podospora australis]|uniref:Coiled-coil domain-containing protein 47 n=1 Tax=Podospora australis TaxID=1536484 RepID=A0AAN6X0V1_9PEZI|nr:coiled-coil domain-containing protein 47 [Podospora australis]